jgi:hypothetical protein
MADIRASDVERDRAVDTLRRHAAEGRLDSGELEERIGLALAAKTRADLARLTADLPAEQQQPRAPRPVARRSHAGICGLHKHDPRALVAWAVVLVAIWALTGAGYFWPMWPLGAFAIAGWSHWRRGMSNTQVIGNTARTSNTSFTQ